MSQEISLTQVRAKLTLTELGVIVSLVMSGVSGIFTFGVMYGRLVETESRSIKNSNAIEKMNPRLERIDANVAFLYDLAKEERLKEKN